MWTLVSGHHVSIIFEYLIIKLHVDNLSNKNIPFLGIVLGWLLQEHIRQDFNMTGGKRFMLKNDFRNRFITQSVKVIRNSIFWIYILNILELGTFILSFSFLLYILTKNFWNFKIDFRIIDIQIFRRNRKSTEEIATLIFSKIQIKYIKEIIIFLIFFTFLKYIFFKTYSLFDFLFVLRPFMLLNFLVLNLILMLWGSYLIYFYTVAKNLFRLGELINVLIFKLNFYIIIGYLYMNFIFIEINYENVTTQNFLKEFIFKLIFLIFNSKNDYNKSIMSL